MDEDSREDESPMRATAIMEDPRINNDDGEMPSPPKEGLPESM
jgi:hypothetical protein